MDKLKYSKKSLKNFTYTDKETADDIYSSINSTQFLGVSVGLVCWILKILIIVFSREWLLSALRVTA